MKSCLVLYSIICLLIGFTHQCKEADHVKKKEQPIQIPDSFEGRSKREGHLTCITFGKAGCKLICQVLCDLYGCESQGFCIGPTCFCAELYEIFFQKYDTAEYQTLSSSILWSYKFGTSNFSQTIYHALRTEREIWQTVRHMLRNPAQTGIDIKNEILLSRPDWHIVHKLQPVRHGYIDDFINENSNKYDYEHFQQYIDSIVEYITDKVYYSARGGYPRRPPWPASETTRGARYLYKLVSLCQNAWLLNYIQGFVRRYNYTEQTLLDVLDPKREKTIDSGRILGVLTLSAIDHLMVYEEVYQKTERTGSQKHTFYYLLSKRQIDELNDVDFEDFEEEMSKRAA